MSSTLLEKKLHKSKKVCIDDFEFQGVLGEGSYGKVHCAIEKST